jgi:hypothetical protein
MHSLGLFNDVVAERYYGSGSWSFALAVDKERHQEGNTCEKTKGRLIADRLGRKPAERWAKET